MSNTKALNTARTHDNFTGRKILVPLIKCKNKRELFKEVTFYYDWLMYGEKTPEMITLRELAKRDRSVAAITSEECRFIAKVLEWGAFISNHKLFKYVMPKPMRERELSMRMLCAVLDKTPEEAKSLTTQIREAMEADAK